MYKAPKKKCADCKNGVDADCNGICDEDEEGGNEMAGGSSDEDEEGGDEMAGGRSDEDEEGGDEMAGGRSDEDEEGGDEMAGGRSDDCADCTNGVDADCNGICDEDEEGGDEMAGGKSDEDEEGGDEMAGGNSDEDEEGGDEMAQGNSDESANECIDGKCENGETCKKKDDCTSPQRFEYIKQTYEEYYPAEATTESSQSSPIILQTIPHYSFSNFYTMNKHHHHHSVPPSSIGPQHLPDYVHHSGIREHLPLELPGTHLKRYPYSPFHPPIPSENDLYQRLKSLPPIFRHSNTNLPHQNQVTSGFSNQQGITDVNVLHLNEIGSSQQLGDHQSIIGNLVQDTRDIDLTNRAPKKYYSTTKQAKNLYSSTPDFPSVPSGPIYRFEDYGIKLRQPKSYNPKFPSSVADKLPPISIKNHGAYGLYNNAHTEYEGHPHPTPPSAMFDFGKYGTNPESILPHLLPPHMHMIKTTPQSFNVGYQSNSFQEQNNVKKPLVRFQYIHHIGPQKEENPETKNESGEEYPAYKIPGPPYNHHTVPLEKQKKRKGKLFQFSNIVKRLLGR